jgi:hypothetical protein
MLKKLLTFYWSKIRKKTNYYAPSLDINVYQGAYPYLLRVENHLKGKAPYIINNVELSDSNQIHRARQCGEGAERSQHEQARHQGDLLGQGGL